MKPQAIDSLDSPTSDCFEALLFTNPVLTASGSRYKDNIWDLSYEMRNRRSTSSSIRLDFRMTTLGSYVRKYRFPQGKELRDYPCFYNHAKRMMAAIILAPKNQNAPNYSGKALIGHLASLKQIYVYLVEQGLSDFGYLTQNTTLHFLNSIGNRAYALRQTLRLMYLYRDYAPSISFDISGKLDIKKIRGTIQQTEPIPDEIFKRFISLCLSYLNDRAEAILSALVTLDSYERYPNWRDRLKHREFWKQIDYETIAALKKPVPDSEKTVRSVIEAARNLQSACIGMLFALTGMRLNELMLIKSDCLVKTSDINGERIWIRSYHTKISNLSGGEQELWLCGKVGENAIGILRRLSAKTRAGTGKDYLIQTLAVDGKYRSNSKKRYKGGTAGAFFTKNAWWARFISVNLGPHVSIETHQFRRTFARWCALTDSGTYLLALKDHFKHSSILMTRYYARVDDELILLFERERDEIKAEAFDKVLRAQSLGGIGGKLLKRNIDNSIENGTIPKDFRGMAGASFRRDFIKNSLLSGMQIKACGGHLCMPIDPNADCGENASFGCNKGSCRNAIYHPDHAPGLAEKIRNDDATLMKLIEITPESSYINQLKEHIKIQKNILKEIT